MTIISENKPQYLHDCNSCQFLGRHEYKKLNEVYDLYYCEDKDGYTVLARYGNDGEAYRSGLVFANQQPLKEALDRAIARGFTEGIY